VDLDCAESTSHVAAQDLRIWHMGWTNSVPNSCRRQVRLSRRNTGVPSGFANTDLDLQLKKHGIHQLIAIGLIAHTCIEATVR
jgi:nicotinamidase-related amidase